jgi:hypothetical protein
MRRVFSLYLYLFSFHWGAALFSGLAVLLLSFGLLFGLTAGSWFLAAFGGVLLLPPTFWSASVFRHLVSNRRLAMLPNFRACAVVALSLMAVTGAFAVALIATADADAPTLASAFHSGVSGFVLLSLLLLSWQWLCTFRAGMLLHLVLLAAVFRFAISGETGQLLDYVDPSWPAVAVGLGWFCLWLGLRARPQPAKPHPSHRIENMGGGSSATNFAGFDWLPTFRLSGAGRPDGTLMRGAIDNWRNRVAAALFSVFGFAALFVLWSFLIGNTASGRAPGPGTASVQTVMLVSFLSLSIGAPLVIAEWPIRLRYLWLRSAGSRPGLWHRLESMVLREIVLITAILVPVAALGVIFAEIDPILALAYVIGTPVGMAFSCYIGFLLRIDGANATEIGVLLVLIFGVVSWFIMAFHDEQIVGLYPFLVLFAGIAWLCRTAARRRLFKIDWCAVRPTRHQGGRGYAENP